MAQVPILWALPLAITIAGQVAATLAARSVARGPDHILSLVPVALAVAVAAPAVASGYNAVVGQAHRHRRASWRDFASHLGTYYWRVAGGALLAGMVLAAVAGSPAGPAAAGLGPTVALVLITLAAEPWFAAVVLDNAGTLAGLSRAARSLWRSFPSYLGPLGLLALATALTYGQPAAMVPGVPGPSPAHLVTGLALALIRALARVAVFDVYAQDPPAA